MASKSVFDEILERFENPNVRWGFVCICIYILVKLKLYLIAALVPVLCYWFMQQNNENEDKASTSELPDPAFHPGLAASAEDNGDVFGDEDLWGNIGSTSSPQRTDPNKAFFSSFTDEQADTNGALFSVDTNVTDEKTHVDSFLGGWSKPETDADDLLGGLSKPDSFFGGFLGGMGNTSPEADDSLDFLGSDFSFDSFGGGSKGKGKGKDKGKRDSGPRPPDPKQIFVAGISDTPEHRIQSFFSSEVGEVDKVKVLTHPDGQSKGVCFVTFRTEEDASKAVALSGMDLDGLRLTLRAAGDRSEGGQSSKGKSKGDMGPRQPDAKQVFVAGLGPFTTDREIQDFFEAEAGEVDRVKLLTHPDGQSKCVCFVTFRTEAEAQTALSLHGTEFQDKRITVRPAGGGKDGGKAGGKGGAGKTQQGEISFSSGARGQRADFQDNELDAGFNEIEEILEEALEEEEDGPLTPQDFDSRSKRLLTRLMQRDRANGTRVAVEALELVFDKVRSKKRDSVQNWNAYVYRLLEGAKEGAKREGRGEAPRQSDVQSAWENMPKEKDANIKVDRWGQPIVMW